MAWSLAIVALVLLGVAAVSRRLSGSPVTPAMLFVAVGVLVGPEVLDGIDLSSTSSTVQVLAEATLALVLFSDASRIDLGQLRREAGVPLRLLGIGLPLTIALGAVAATVIFGELTVEEAVILAIVLAPTDAALGQAVVTEPRVPPRIRQGLNVESGLNDGICVPLLFAAVAVADVGSHISEGRSPGTLLLEEVGYGIVGGVAAGLLIAAIVIHAGRRDLIAGQWRPVIPAAGAALAYGTASALDGSGFIAAFVAGMVFRAALGRDPEDLNQLNEQVGDVLNGVTFLLFGAILLGPALGQLSWELALYAVISLTVVRMVPVAIAMWRSGARAPTLGFLGWFGPRGLASIVFALIVVEESQLPHESLIVLAIYVTVGLSVFAHGLTAAPLADRYARWYEHHPRDKAPPMESARAEVTRPRGPAETPTRSLPDLGDS
ncbi:MAG: sodium/hydrogen antiporter [Solirubrobacteraceae bacterium]|jgi:NhaP-type Na+/H+ or K+/H+ antiporter|nr:sodium/hydrogen antiporter [Solirubrobacteraceae bacterium]